MGVRARYHAAIRPDQRSPSCDWRHAPLFEQSHVVFRPFLWSYALLLGQLPHMRRHHEGAVGTNATACGHDIAARDRSGIAAVDTGAIDGTRDAALDELEIAIGIDGVTGVEGFLMGLDSTAHQAAIPTN